MVDGRARDDKINDIIFVGELQTRGHIFWHHQAFSKAS